VAGGEIIEKKKDMIQGNAEKYIGEGGGKENSSAFPKSTRPVRG